jgi:hypothetical protein
MTGPLLVMSAALLLPWAYGTNATPFSALIMIGTRYSHLEDLHHDGVDHSVGWDGDPLHSDVPKTQLIFRKNKERKDSTTFATKKFYQG